MKGSKVKAASDNYLMVFIFQTRLDVSVSKEFKAVFALFVFVLFVKGRRCNIMRPMPLTIRS